MKIWEVVRVVDDAEERGECVDAFPFYMEASDRAKMLNDGSSDTFIVICKYVD